MKKTMMTIIFAAASLPMFAAHQAAPAAPANPPAVKNSTSEAKPVVKTKKAHKKVVKKSSEKKAVPASTAPVAK
jgi:hypothetical protein